MDGWTLRGGGAVDHSKGWGKRAGGDEEEFCEIGERYEHGVALFTLRARPFVFTHCTDAVDEVNSTRAMMESARGTMSGLISVGRLSPYCSGMLQTNARCRTPFSFSLIQAVDWVTNNEGTPLLVLQREDHVKFGFGASGRAAR